MSEIWTTLVLPLLLGNFLNTANSAPIQENDSLCHPILKSLDQVYLVGYGSLLSSKSKNNTSPNTGTNIPVNVKGFSRKFNCKGSFTAPTTFLGVDDDNKSFFNGVVFKLPSLENLLEYDKREIYYCRKEVNISDIEFLINTNFSSDVDRDFPGEEAQLWIYTVKPEFFGWPTKRYPIVQSYVDTFLAGCIEMEKTYNLTNYENHCINTKDGWQHDWINDRVLPRRPYIYTPMALQVDTLIQNHFPDHFDKVYIEQEIMYNSDKKGLARNYSERLGLHFIFQGLIGFLVLLRLY